MGETGGTGGMGETGGTVGNGERILNWAQAASLRQRSASQSQRMHGAGYVGARRELVDGIGVLKK